MLLFGQIKKKIGSYCSEGFHCRTTARTHRNHLQNIKPYSFGQGTETGKSYKILTSNKKLKHTQMIIAIKEEKSA